MSKSEVARPTLGETIRGWGWAGVSFFLFCLFVLIPIASVVVYSFTNWDGMTLFPEFVGLDNYRRVLTSSEFLTSIGNNLKFLIFGVPLWTMFPLIVSVLLYQEVKGWKFFRSAYFFPSVVSTAVIGSLFRTLFLYDGPINGILSWFGIDPVEWFAQGNLALGLIIVVITWVGFGSTVLIILAGMANLDEAVFEAAELDGAGWWTTLFKVTMPMLAPTIAFVLMLNVMSAFTGVFGFVFMMTGGGPGYETTVLEYLLYTSAFKLHDFGFATALSVILFLQVIAVTLLQRIVTREKD